jgi:ATP-dependent DNA helicase Rep
MNPEQTRAVRYLDGPLLVIAGAGSGKTRVITEKIAYLLEKAHYSPKHIAAITFTNKAAHEMMERINKRLAPHLTRGLTVATFHALGLTILRQEAPYLGYKAHFSMLDSADAGHILQSIVNTTDKQAVRALQAQISAWKNQGITPFEALRVSDDEASQLAAQAYATYETTLLAYQAVDFDDLIALPVKLFANHPERLAVWQQKLRYLLVDEYQDTNHQQYQLIQYLTAQHQQLTVVGDDDQSIYAWRGANRDNLLRLQTDFPCLAVIKLEQNYRSSVRILTAANVLIAHNKPLFEKKLWSQLGHGEPIQLMQCKHEDHEVESVLMQLSAHKLANRTRWQDYAILYRSNYQSRLFEQALRLQNIPYQMADGSSFFDKSEIKTLWAYVTLMVNPKDDAAFIRAMNTPKRGIGTQTLATLSEWSNRFGTSFYDTLSLQGLGQALAPAQAEALSLFYQLIDQLQAKSGSEPAAKVLMQLCEKMHYEAYLYDEAASPKQAESMWRNVLDFIAWIDKRDQQTEKTLAQWVQSIALMGRLANDPGEDVDAVHLSTLHAAKGLEYPHVFLIGVEEGLMPHAVSIDEGHIEEERRLMYVGITRAMRSLTITHCQKRKKGGEWQFVDRSRFIDELPLADCRYFGLLNQGPQVTKEEGIKRLAAITAMLNQTDSV